MIEFVKKDKKTGRVTFLLKNSHPGFANALRRLMIEEVPTMAIEDVEFSKNDSALYDEMLAHRLGLITLTTDLKGYEVKKADDEVNAKNSVKLSLKAKGPCTVYAEEMKSKDPKVKPHFGKTPIVKLLKGQELEFEATAILGTSRQHVKFAPCLAWYSYQPKVTVNNSSKDLEKFRAKYPPQIFNGNKIDAKLIEQNNLYEAVDGINDDIIKVERDPTTFVFHIESWGQLSAQEILATAADKLITLTEKFSEALNK